MTNSTKNHPQEPENPVYRNQLITKGDLFEFKENLMEELKSIVREVQEHGGKKWLRSRDVKKLLGVSHGTLQNMRINGDLPYNKVGGVIFYDVNDIQKMIDANRFDNSI